MKVIFSIPYHTDWGQQVYITGSMPILGSWDVNNAFLMKYMPTDTWVGEFELPKGVKNFEYKYIIKADYGVVKKEGGNNRIFTEDYILPIRGGIDKKDCSEIRDFWRDSSSPDTLFYSSAFSNAIFGRGRQDSQPVRKTSIPSGKWHLRIQANAVRVDPEHILCIRNLQTKEITPMHYSSVGLWAADLFIDADKVSFRYEYLIKDKKGKEVLCFDDEIREVERIDYKNTVINDERFLYSSNWKGAGVAMPVFSLRSRNSLGVGEFTDLKLLIDWAKEAGLQLIQILPVNDTSVHMNWLDSFPYSALSVFALHPMYLNLQDIGGLPKKILSEISRNQKILNNLDHVDYGQVIELKRRLIREIYKIKKKRFLGSKEFKDFLKENLSWLKPYSAFCLLRDKYKTSDYNRWGKYTNVSGKDINEITSPKSKDFESVAENYFIQYYLHKQLKEASLYGREKNIVLKGDIPIGVHKFSDSCWYNPEIFNITESAGAPPDPFSDTGQNWEFPTYNWDKMRADNYSWWGNRLSLMSNYFQMARIDHILGFFRIWEIPADNISGLMGHFNPAIPVSREELEGQGIWDLDRLCKPHIPLWLIKILLGPSPEKVISVFFEDIGNGYYGLKPEFVSQRQVEEYLLSSKSYNEKIRTGLLYLISNVVMFKDPYSEGFHPRINMMDTASFACLDGSVRDKLTGIYYNYFYHRQEGLWREKGMTRLPVIKESSHMLICGEDLGMIPDCVPPVLERLNILGLRIQRMPKETDREFGYTDTYPYLTVCTTGSHDMSTIRGWWEEDSDRTQRYYKKILKQLGKSPCSCTPQICKGIINLHLKSLSMWAVFPLQDILAIDQKLRWHGDPSAERINVPGDPHHKWQYRMHLNLEDLIADKIFSGEIRKMIVKSDRLRAY